MGYGIWDIKGIPGGLQSQSQSQSQPQPRQASSPRTSATRGAAPPGVAAPRSAVAPRATRRRTAPGPGLGLGPRCWRRFQDLQTLREEGLQFVALACLYSALLGRVV